MAAATFGSQLLVADQEARFFVVDPPTCAKSEPACLRPAGVLPGEVLEVGTRLTVGADATRYLVEEDTMRAFDQTLAVLFDVQATGRIVAAVPTGTEGLALAANGQVALLAVPRCTRESLHLPDIATGPKQCVRWIYGDNLDDAAPAVVDPDTLAVNGNKRIQAVVAGTDSWKSPIDSVGPVLVGSDELLYTMTVENSPTASTLSLAAVRPDRGTVAWSVPLPLPSEATGDGSADASLAEVVAPENLSLDVAGAWVAAGFDRHVTVVSVPASPPAASQG